MKLLRESLLQFLGAGAVIFGLYGLTRGVTETTTPECIVVTTGDIERLAGLWQKRWQQPLLADELKGLIKQNVQEEVLYRDAHRDHCRTPPQRLREAPGWAIGSLAAFWLVEHIAVFT
jgi:hypothetical protein